MKMRKTLHNTGFFILLVFAGAALFAPQIAPHDPWARFAPYLPPDGVHILGTNDMGNDIFSELLYGARVSLFVGFAAAVMATAIGLIVGLLSGYYRGLMDDILMGLTDVVLMIPRIPLIIILAAFLSPGYGIMIVVLGLLWWASTARVVRSKTMQIRTMPFVESARVLGFSDLHILFSDVMPNLVQVVLPKFMLTVASAMISEASLSFLGLGDPVRKSWGMMLNFAFREGGLIREMWWWIIPPGLCITLCVLSVMSLTRLVPGEKRTKMQDRRRLRGTAAPY